MSSVFHRIILEPWHHILPIIAFALTFAVFVFVFIRAILMTKDRAESLASLPLADATPNPSESAADPMEARQNEPAPEPRACECGSCLNRGLCRHD